MKKGVKITLIFVGVIVALLIIGYAILSYLGSPSSPTEIVYQEAQDPIRIQHVNYIASLVEEYHTIKGFYPFADKYGGNRISVFITTNSKDVEYYQSQDTGYPVDYFSRQELLEELKSVLGDDVDLPNDPQKVASGRPIMYVYEFSGKEYFVAGHLYNEYPLARYVAPYYYKYEVSSSSFPKQKIYKYSDVMDFDESSIDFDNNDEQRIADVRTIQGLIEEYYDIKGYYPLADRYEELKEADGTFNNEINQKLYEYKDGVPIDVMIDDEWHGDLEGLRISYVYYYTEIDYPRILFSKSDFVAELRSVLGEDVEIPDDPRKFAIYAPNIYTYRFLDGNYYVTTYLHNFYEGATEISEHNYGFEVSNVEEVLVEPSRVVFSS